MEMLKYFNMENYKRMIAYTYPCCRYCNLCKDLIAFEVEFDTPYLHFTFTLNILLAMLKQNFQQFEKELCKIKCMYDHFFHEK